jgi:glycosyltransferase involved in cell wall biosynthesis
LFIEAAALVLNRQKGVFLLIGDGHLRDKLERRVQALQISTQVIFCGHRDDVEEILAGSDMAVNTSDSEGLSNSIMEAMRAAIPVVASDVPGNRELIKSGINGLLFNAGDFNDLSEKILTILLDPERGAIMGQTNAEIIKNSYSIEKMTNDFERLYLSVID